MESSGTHVCRQRGLSPSVTASTERITISGVNGTGHQRYISTARTLVPKNRMSVHFIILLIINIFGLFFEMRLFLTLGAVQAVAQVFHY